MSPTREREHVETHLDHPDPSPQLIRNHQHRLWICAPLVIVGLLLLDVVDGTAYPLVVTILLHASFTPASDSMTLVPRNLHGMAERVPRPDTSIVASSMARATAAFI